LSPHEVYETLIISISYLSTLELGTFLSHVSAPLQEIESPGFSSHLVLTLKVKDVQQLAMI